MTGVNDPRRVAVTGAANGIDRATALRFAQDGDAVAALDVDAARTAGLEVLASGRGLPLRTRELDLVDGVAVRRVLDAPVGDLGGLDVLVDNAGIGMAATVPDTSRAAYCASKAGLIGLTRALATDHARHGIRVSAICPRTVATQWVERIVADAVDREAVRSAMAARQPDGRMGTAEEVAEGIASLASPQAHFVNGSAFVMDGGMTAV